MLKPGIKITPYRFNRSNYGAIYNTPTSACYLAYRKTSDIFRAGEKSISDAVRAGTAAWAIDETTLLDMRAKGIRIVGVLVRENGDMYLTAIDNFFDRTKAKLLNYEARGGALQRYLPLEHFKVSYGKMTIKKR